MKKFFTLMLTLVLTAALSVNAQSLALKSVAKKAPAKEAVASQIKKTVKPARSFKQAVTGKQMLKGESMKIAKPANANKVRKAEGDVVNYEVAPENVSCYYYSSDNDWYMCLRCDDGSRFYFDYVSDTFEGTFTLDDCLTDYCHYMDADYNYDDPTSLDLTVSGDLSKNFEVTATVVGESGTVYNVHAIQDKYIDPVKTVNVTATCLQAVFEGSTSTYLLQGDDNAMYQIALEGTTGTFDVSSITEESTIRQSAEGEIAQYNNGTVTVSMDQDYLATAAADIVMSDSVEYIINWTYQLEPVGTKDVVATNCRVDDSYFSWFGIYWFYGSNDEYTDIEAICAPESYEIIEQDFSSSECSFSLTDNDGNQISLMVFNEAHQAIDEETGLPIITGTFLGSDLVKYNVNLSFAMPEEQGTKEYTLENLAFNNLLSDGAYQVYGYNADQTQYASIVAYSEEVPGEFSLEDGTLYSDYTYFALTDPETGSATEMVEFLKGTATAEMDESGFITIKTHLFAYDGYWYDLTLTSQFEKAHLDYDSDSEVDVAFTKDDVDNFFSDPSNGYAYWRCTNAERSDCFAMLIYSSEFDDVTYVPAGTYEVSDSYEPGTVQPGELSGYSVYPTFYCTIDEEGYVNTPLWFLTQGTVTIMNVDGELAFEVNGMNSYDRSFHVTYNFDPTGINNVSYDSNGNVKKYLNNKNVVIVKGDKKFNAVGQEVKF